MLDLKADTSNKFSNDTDATGSETTLRTAGQEYLPTPYTTFIVSLIYTL